MKRRRIIDTGKHHPRARIWDLWELQSQRKKLVEKPILGQSRRDKTIIYGRYAVNQLLGRGYHRDTYDFDIYSRKPLSHAIEIEQSIDRGTNSNLAFVERSTHRSGLYRVKTRHDTVEADYNLRPKGVQFQTKHGIRFETLDRAEKKYQGMINRGETHRFPKAFWDLDDIKTHNRIKKSKWR